MPRALLQVRRADYYDPRSQLVVKLTEPVLPPLHRIGRIEGGPLLVIPVTR